MIVKHVGLYDANPARGLPHHPATICAFDAATGALRAVLDATELTAARTAGAAALSIRLAARADARVAAVIGAGPVAAAHLRVLPAVLPGAELRVAARDPARAAGAGGGARRGRGAAVGEAVRGADVVCLCTSATEPVVAPGWLAPGTHVSSVGYAPPGGELRPGAGAQRGGCSSRRATRSRRRPRAAPSWPGWTRPPPRSWARCARRAARRARPTTSSPSTSRWGR